MTPKRGDAYWMLCYTTPAIKLRREYTIGKVDDWSLADSRDEAARLGLAIKREGADPVQERRKVNQNPFKKLEEGVFGDKPLPLATHVTPESSFSPVFTSFYASETVMPLVNGIAQASQQAVLL